MRRVPGVPLRRSIVLLSIVLAFGAVACGSKKSGDTSTPTLPSGGVTTAQGGVSTTVVAQTAPASTFKPTPACNAINAFRYAEAGPVIYPEADKQAALLQALNSTAAAVKTEVPELASSIDTLVANATALSSTSSTAADQKAPGEEASAKVTDYWNKNCM